MGRAKKQKGMRFRTKFLVVLFSLVCVWIFFNNFIVKESLKVYVGHVVGAKIDVDRLEFNVFQQTLDISGLEIWNPKGFEEKPFVRLAHGHLEFNFFALFLGNLHFPILDLDVEQITLIENPDGVSNLDSLKIIQKNKTKKKEKNFRPLRFKIGQLTLNVESVIKKRLTQKTPVITVKKHPIKNKTYNNISSFDKLIVLVLFESVRNMAIRSAGVHAASAVLGVSSIPISIASFILKKDNASGDFKIEMDEAMQRILSLAKRLGKVLEVNPEEGLIKARIYSARVIIRLRAKSKQSTYINVQVRKWLIPRKEHAAGILYLIAEELEK